MLNKSQNINQSLTSTTASAALPYSNLNNYKVSIIVGDLSGKGAGRWGGAVRPFLLEQALRRLGLGVEILGFTDDTTTPLPTNSGVVIKRFAQRTYPKFVSSAAQLIRQIDGDILYAYKTKVSSFGVGLLARQWQRRPLILDIDDWEMSWHGGDQWCYQPSLKQRYRDLFKPDGALRQPDHPVYLHRMEQMTQKADAITVHTRFLQKKFGGTYVPNGKDTTLFDPSRYDRLASRQRYGLEGYRVLMFPGAPRPHKGLEDILTALDLINQPDLKLVIVGGSPYDNYDQSLTQRWGQHIIKLPKLPHDQMPDVVAAADVIVVPQQDTPVAQAQFPLKLTDGMAMAKPILTTRVGDIPDTVGDTGFLVNPGDCQAMADQINAIFADITGSNLRGQDARHRCVTHFSIEAMAQILVTIIAPLLNPQKASLTL